MLEIFLFHGNTKRYLPHYLNCSIIVSCWETICCCLQQYWWIKHCQFSRQIEVSLWRSWHFGCTTLYYHAKRNIFCQLHVACSDTDALFLLLYFYPYICNNTVFHTATQEIDVGCAHKCIKEHKKYGPVRKTTCFNTFLKSNLFAHEAFASLGNNDNVLKKDVINGLKTFVLDLHQPKRSWNIK